MDNLHNQRKTLQNVHTQQEFENTVHTKPLQLEKKIHFGRKFVQGLQTHIGAWRR